MQFKLLSAIALATLAVATPTRRTGGGGGEGDECSTGPVQCCNSVQTAGSEPAAGLLTLLGIVVQDLNVPVGITCTAISVVGGGNSCSAQTVCCKDNSFHGVVAIGCTPINIGL